jgi:hypothetical protein
MFDACFLLVTCLAYTSAQKRKIAGYTETSVSFYGIHGVTSQKIVIFVISTLRTSNIASDSSVEGFLNLTS